MSLVRPADVAVAANAEVDARSSELCAHCGAVSGTDETDPQGHRFCCSGCRTVYAVLHAEGLNDYYELRERSGAAPRAARTTGRSYEELDDAGFLERTARPLPKGLMVIELYVEGVHCSACVWLVERIALTVDGAVDATLDIGRSSVRLVWDPARTRLSAIARSLDRLGYPVHPARGSAAELLRRKERRSLMVRMGVAFAAAGNAMLFASALYGGEFTGMEPQFVTLFRWLSLAVSLPAVLWSAWPFFRGAWASLVMRTPHMDLPIAVGILTGFVGGAVATWRGQGGVFFDTITVLIFLLLVGRFIQLRQQDLARNAAEMLHALAPARARRLEADGPHDIPADALLVGDQIEVRAGEHVPADGRVVTGESMLDRAWLTGEPLPDAVGPGDTVHAGCTNLRAPLVIAVECAGLETRVAQLIARVEQAAQRRARVVRLADRVSAYFVLVVHLLALLTFIGWSFFDLWRAFDNTVALLVATCPCALGMATPLAVTAALGRAARQGLLVKGGDALEQLAGARLVVFDKTGTLTEGRLELVLWEGPLDIQPHIRALELEAVHPVADAFVRALPAGTTSEVTSFTYQPGGGIAAEVAGRRFRVGSSRYFQERGLALPDKLERTLAAQVALGRTPVLIAEDDQIVALAAFADPLRADTVQSLRKLHALGLELAVLSGDHPLAVAAVAAQLGVPLRFVEGGISPEGKLERIEQLARNHRVVMVGDGLNDAAALSAASVGVAVHGGAEASLEAADAFSTHPGVNSVRLLIEGSRRTLSTIRRGLVFSLAYNVIAIGLAMAGHLSPLMAAVLMPLSSLTVLTNAFRARTFGGQT